MSRPAYARILVIQLRHVGDVLLTTPALHALRRAFPAAVIDFLVEPASRPVLARNADVDHVLVRGRGDSLWRGIRLLWRVRRNRYDLVVDYQHLVRTGLIAWCSGAALRLSYAHSLRRHLYTRTAAQPRAGYIARAKLALLRDAGVACPAALDAQRPRMEVGAEARREVAHWLATQGPCDGRPLVSIDPMSRKGSRRWDGYAELADRLATDCGACVVFLWGPGARDRVEALMAACRVPHLIAPATDLEQLAALIECCDLHVGNDSAPRHLAVARRTPSLTVVVQTEPETWTFPDRHHRTVCAAIGRDGSDAAAAAHRAALEQLVRDARELIAGGRGQPGAEAPAAVAG